MHFISDYTTAFTHWLQLHPEWALLIVFLVSFAESLAIVGLIIPGTVMMAMLGVLAGSGAIRIDLTIITAIVGAFMGDAASYYLGQIVSERLYTWWPFTLYPQWLHYAKVYFECHGVKSIFLGRFIGPLRSFIPVIAGMMHMKQSKFLIADFFSAILWALFYLGPGILIGTASTEISSADMRYWFMLIMFGLGSIICLVMLLQRFGLRFIPVPQRYRALVLFFLMIVLIGVVGSVWYHFTSFVL